MLYRANSKGLPGASDGFETLNRKVQEFIIDTLLEQPPQVEQKFEVVVKLAVIATPAEAALEANLITVSIFEGFAIFSCANGQQKNIQSSDSESGARFLDVSCV